MCKRGKGEEANVTEKSQFFTNEEILKFVHFYKYLTVTVLKCTFLSCFFYSMQINILLWRM